ncbi:MAG: hypothetical protein JWM12_3780 [Ilumatobacteraceae bacterium]|nr:hypothetical protein [Ilumatobacteraceae bacterium]
MSRRAPLPSADALGTAARFAAFGAVAGVPLPSQDAWFDATPDIVVERASGMALQRLRDIGADGDVPADVRDALMAARRHDSMRALGIAGMTLPFLKVLRDRGIRSVLIKGLAVARHYPVREMRSFGDVDIVVPPGQFHAALRIAHEHGLHPPASDLQPHRSFDLQCREGLNLADEHGLVRLDLHHHVGPWAFASHLGFERLHAFAETIEVHGHRVRVASPTHSLAIAALHLISEQWQKKLSLATWSDVAVVANSLDPGATVEELRAIHLDWLLAAVVGALPAGVQPSQLLTTLGAPPIPRTAALRLRLLDADSLVGRHPASWAVRLPVPNAVWFLGGSAVPSREYLVGRFGDDASYRMWWSQAFRWATRAVRGDDVSSPYSPGRTSPAPASAAPRRPGPVAGAAATPRRRRSPARGARRRQCP